MKGTVKQAFPFAFDGANFLHLKAGDEFPPAGYTVQDTTFQGLKDAGFIEAVTRGSSTPADEDLNRRIIDALDKRLSAASDEELKAIIVRRGTPFSGNMVHAVLVSEAKQQMLVEMEGGPAVFTGIDPNSGVTEQPLSAPGQATPPSAATAVAAQQTQQGVAQHFAQEADLEQNDSQAGAKQVEGSQGAGENKATNQFGEPISGTVPSQANNPAPEAESKFLTEAELTKLNKADLEAYAKEKGIDLADAKTKDDYIAALKPKS